MTVRGLMWAYVPDCFLAKRRDLLEFLGTHYSQSIKLVNFIGASNCVLNYIFLGLGFVSSL